MDHGSVSMLARMEYSGLIVRWSLALVLIGLLPSVLWAQPNLRQLPSNTNGGFSSPNFNSPMSGQDSFNNQPAARMASNPNTGAWTPSNAPVTDPNATAKPASESQLSTRNLLQLFNDGGWMMYPIALCSFVLTVFVFERLISLRWGRVIPRPFVRRLIEQLQQQQIDREEALELCERNPSAIAQILAAAVKKYGKPAVEVEQAVLDAGERVSNQLRRHLRLINSISNVSPLLGLLGTVLGMIEAFNAIASSDQAARSQLLAGGIGHAMLTTAAGLLVAIPAYLSYMYFLGRTDRLIMEMDEFAQQVVEAISAEGLAESDHSRSRSRSRKAA